MIQSVSYQQTDITGGFWAHRQQLNRAATTPSVYHQFDQTGRIGAFACNWTPDMDPEKKPHVFWDSDVAKWMEGAAYELAKQPDDALEAQVDAIVDQIAAHQQPDGYFNIYYMVVEPGNRFTQRARHELYCAGHLIEAAVAYAQATGKTKLLDCMCRYADLIDQIFRVEQSAGFATPGHEEIELALVRLADYTGESRYLDLARWFIDQRGCQPMRDYEGGDPRQRQTHLPVRQQRTAEGHAVRAAYLYCAMADLAKRDGDEALADACRALYRNITQRRMYITGGIGSAATGECFTMDYDLENMHAYAESCAAIALAMFSQRMLLLEPDSTYADTIERVLYNGFLSSTSLNGKEFFYENPLEIQPKLVHRYNADRFPITQRVEVFNCSCCPPNIVRFVASLGGMLYTKDEAARTVYVNQYMESKTEFDYCGETARLIQETNYPVNGKIRVTWHGPDTILALRVPGWVRGFAVPTDRGYIRRAVSDGDVVTLEFPMEPVFMAANPHVGADAGRAAVMRGPVVYCMESVDNGEDLRDIQLIMNKNIAVEPESACGLPVLMLDGERCAARDDLYSDVRDAAFEPVRVRMIPYFAFANRGESEMLVWTLARRG